MKLHGRTLLVTGASGGIGVELCKLLHAEGVRLLLSGSRVTELQRLNQALGGFHHYVHADLNSTEGRAQVIAACVGIGGVDGLINLAGTLDFNLFARQSAAQIENIGSTNFLAPMLLCHGLLPVLSGRPEAIILNVGSIFGSIGHPGFVAYCASKAGIKGFTEALSRELADTSIRVAYIAPRATNTSMNNSRVNAMNALLGNKSDSPQFVAQEIVKQLRSTARTRYLGWPEKLFVRVNALFPGLVHKSLVRNLAIIKQFAVEEATP